MKKESPKESCSKFYLTTTIPYVNADPHIGFALEIVQADSIARLKKLQGNEVFFNFGTDEHGQKIYQKALEEGKDPKAYCDEYVLKFDELKQSLNLSYNNFIRTTDEHHIKAAQEFWVHCNQNGDIYKKNYKTKYCVGCELEKTDSELDNGRCPLHPNREIEIREEENYFFRFSKYQRPLLDFYAKNPNFVAPESKFKEIRTFVEGGLQDFSVSRLKEKMPWGVDVPGDPDHVMYVWFDALVNYISALGWPENEKKFNDFWPGMQVAGKDNLRQQSAIWQAMLLSAGLANSKQIFIHGFITVDGQKISKSLGNVINPLELVKKYGTDSVRYFLLAKLHPYDDSDFTYEKFENAYNSDLANGLGNLVSRTARMAEMINIESNFVAIFSKNIELHIKEFRFDLALNSIWENIKKLDVLINENELWKNTESKIYTLLQVIEGIQIISFDLQPFLPQTAEKIQKQFSGKIKSGEPLFPRLK